MKIPAAFARLPFFASVADSRLGLRSLVALLGIILALSMSSRVLAQGYDDHNPVGVTGIFNGNVTTACSYDPLTHSARRVIDDIVVL